MKAVHFGAGNIGRGFIGLLLYQSGFETCFVDVNKEIVDLLNEKRQYTVQLANEAQEQFSVENVYGINSVENPEQVAEAIAHSDLVTAAVGPTILPMIAGAIANGLKKRLTQTKKELTIIACENMIGGSALLKEKIYEQLTDDERGQFDQYYSFPNAAVDRIVPNQINEDKLMVTVEPFYEWIVDQSEIKGVNPPIHGITFVEDLQPYIERKLFTVNTGHAVVAYLGYSAGIPYIAESLQNKEIREMTACILQETSKYLITKYSFDRKAHMDYVEKIIQRFANPYISDETTRVGRSPIRKLNKNDRLIRPATQYVEMFHETPNCLAKGIAAALSYDYLNDPEAKEIQEKIQQKGVENAIETFTGLKADTDLFTAVCNNYYELVSK
ncbi:mannitol-1-phosphate 5-dehydrogenase [Cytobacillus eiseniae]|uniref:Mannitol-1-phosphate 5-dehydrogenase n=1 Tax=Cytobacillus eiseniae TaxID=762947 RepID=A0ABS4RFC7_9BACI|nr:mannitol-1-phosphate 5-dehydrogenase [Cytobacillus eiseniae]MBP2241019.1 mannitol-1-phosphate 5-dehydrogenase [Cytobacillus eiseniae]